MQVYEKYMIRCLELARKGAGYVAPNPVVGAVLVHNNIIIGEGWHHEFGGPHAEVNCLQSVSAENKKLIPESTLYVSLEPCSHFGKTPPCTTLIIQHNIKHVVIGCRDSNEKVDGISKLHAAGIETTVGVLENECRKTNKRFFCFHEKKRPYIILKWAQTKNGFIANTDKSRILISNEETNRLVHKWRSEEAAIMVGAHTALLDNPELTVRNWNGKNPVRVISGVKGKLPGSLNIFNDKAETILTSSYNPEEITALLYEKELNSVLIEGGTKTLQAFINSGLWDEARVIVNEELKRDTGYEGPVLFNEKKTKEETIKDNMIEYFENSKT